MTYAEQKEDFIVDRGSWKVLINAILAELELRYFLRGVANTSAKGRPKAGYILLSHPAFWTLARSF